jgi:hypothetical protein
LEEGYGEAKKTKRERGRTGRGVGICLPYTLTSGLGEDEVERKLQAAAKGWRKIRSLVEGEKW